MKRRSFIGAAALLMSSALVLAGCSGGSGSDKGDSGSSSGTKEELHVAILQTLRHWISSQSIPILSEESVFMCMNHCLP